MKKKRKSRKKQRFKEPLWLSSLKAFVLGVLFIGATGRVMVFYSQIAFFVLGVFVALFLSKIAFSGPIAIAVSFLSGFLIQAQGLNIPFITLFFLFPAFAFLGAFVGDILKGSFNRKHIALILLVLICFNFLIQSFVVSKRITVDASKEPPAEGYSFDPIFFLKVYYLMKGGEGFYKAFDRGFREDSRFDKPYTTVSGWRSPVLFWVWSKLFSNGSDIVYAFIFLSFVSLIVAYLLAEKASDEVSALVTSALLATYLLYAIPSWWFLELEFWATFIAIFSAYFFYTEKEKVSWGLALFSGLIREWLVSNVLAGVVEKVSKKEWKKAISWNILFIFIAGFYIVNSILVANYLRSVGFEPGVGLKNRIGGGGVDFILYTLQFCSQFFLSPQVIPYLAFGFALLGAIALIKNKDYFLPSLLLLPLMAFLFIGSGKGLGDPPGWNDYYNASFMPFAFIVAPAFWKVFLWERIAGRK
jgi:hypothetical protein